MRRMKPLHRQILEWKGMSGPEPRVSAAELADLVEEWKGDHDGDMDAIQWAMFELVVDRLRSADATIVRNAALRQSRADLAATLVTIADIAEGSKTANSLPNIARLARSALKSTLEHLRCP
jgi:hypothetical protein